MKESNDSYESDIEDDHQERLPDGFDLLKYSFTKNERSAARKKMLELRRAVDELHEEQKLVNELLNVDPLLTWDKNDLLGEFR